MRLTWGLLTCVSLLALPLHAQRGQSLDDFALCSFGSPDRAASKNNYATYVAARSKEFVQAMKDLESRSKSTKSGETESQQLTTLQFREELAAKLGAFAVSDNLQGVACSESLLDWKEAKNVYGRAIAGTYIAVEVTVRNLDPDHEFLLHQVELAANPLVLPPETSEAIPGRPWVEARGKRVARGVLERGQDYSARNTTIRILELVASTAASAALIGSTDFNNGVNIFGGAFVPGLRTTLPDLTIRQLNRFDDTTFESGTILVPKRGAISFVTFINGGIFGHLPKLDRAGLPLRDRHGNIEQVNFKDFNGDQLLQYQNQLAVVISGAHVQEIATKPSISAIDPAELTLDKSSVILHVAGQALTGVRALRFRTSSDEKSEESRKDVYLKLDDRAGSMGSAEVVATDEEVFPKAAAHAATTYRIVFVLSDGSTALTDKSITLTPKQ